MWISEIKLENIKSFILANLSLSPEINVIVGKNNAGKSTILKGALRIQDNKALKTSDLRYGCSNGSLHVSMVPYNSNIDKLPYKSFTIHLPDFKNSCVDSKNQSTTISNIQNYTFYQSQEPINALYPYLSKRKSVKYNEGVQRQFTNSVLGTFENLYAKVDRISNPDAQPVNSHYVKACQDILGFKVSSVASDAGKKAAYNIKNFENIPIEDMGEGVPNLLCLIIDLCNAENKIFVIEEPENDIHPEALKRLLDLVLQKSETNQFIITTHSNIVVRQLGAQKSTSIFNVDMNFDEKVPTSTVSKVGDSTTERLSVLERLGYELFDFGLWGGWLILEESSAEKIIRDYLIPWFCPSLKYKLRTFSARCLSEVERKFENFNNLFVFLHLQPSYLNKAWVIIDNGDEELKIIAKLQRKYATSGWNAEQFKQFEKHDFEKYYPQKFQSDVTDILAIHNKKEKRSKKKSLLDQLEVWIKQNEELAKDEFQKSADEVIGLLKFLENQL